MSSVAIKSIDEKASLLRANWLCWDLCSHSSMEGSLLKKCDVIDLLRDMPEEINTEDLIYRLYLKDKLEASEAAAAAGDVLSHEEVVRITDGWFR